MVKSRGTSGSEGGSNKSSCCVCPGQFFSCPASCVLKPCGCCVCVVRQAPETRAVWGQSAELDLDPGLMDP